METAKEPISTNDCIREMYKLLVTGNGTPPMTVRMDRVERALELLSKIMTLLFVPIILAFLLAISGFIWALITHQIIVQ